MSQNIAEEMRVRQSRNKLLLIAAIAFVPMMIAYAVFFFAPQLIPSGTTNRGVLIQPALDLSGYLDSGGQWLMLLPNEGSCSKECQQVLHQTRQIHIALGKNSDRVARVYIGMRPLAQPEATALKAEYPNLQYRWGPKIVEDLSRLEQSTEEGRNRVFIMDPLGQVILAYPKQRVDKPLLLDLKHLLKISNLG